MRLLNREGEEYFITFPRAVAKGLFMGTLRMEIGGKSEIICERTDYYAEFEWKEKPLMGGDYSCIVAKIKQGGRNGKVVRTIDGKWNRVLKIKDPKKRGDEVLFDVAKTDIAAKMMLPVENMGEWESRKLWGRVTDAFRGEEPDWAAVSREKSALEEAQRQLPCHSHGGQETEGWETKKFHLQPWVSPISGEEEQVWTFDDTNLEPYQEGEEEREFVSLSQSLPDERETMDEWRAKQ